MSQLLQTSESFYDFLEPWKLEHEDFVIKFNLVVRASSQFLKKPLQRLNSKLKQCSWILYKYKGAIHLYKVFSGLFPLCNLYARNMFEIQNYSEKTKKES